jgi:hypothetical protein
MIQPNGAPYVPLNCPSHDEGKMIPDLREADFHMGVLVRPGYDEPESTVVTYASFIVGDPTGTEHYLTSGQPRYTEAHSRVNTVVLEEPSSSPLAQQLLRFAGLSGDAEQYGPLIRPQDSPQAERMRELLCNRAATCHGLLGGECWAMGESGFRQVLAETLQPNTEA